MDINWLIQRLRHGDSYTVQDGDNDPYQVNNPPNSLMIKAAEVIIRQSNELGQASEIIGNLQRQLEEINAAYQTLRDSSTFTATGGKAG
jgi:5-methylcytosine-specific restriction endonuclease McrBC regulatory subunit McrC